MNAKKAKKLRKLINLEASYISSQQDSDQNELDDSLKSLKISTETVYVEDINTSESFNSMDMIKPYINVGLTIEQLDEMGIMAKVKEMAKYDGQILKHGTITLDKSCTRGAYQTFKKLIKG